MDAVEIVETANTERKLAMYNSARTAHTHTKRTQTHPTRVCACAAEVARVCARAECVGMSECTRACSRGRTDEHEGREPLAPRICAAREQVRKCLQRNATRSFRLTPRPRT